MLPPARLLCIRADPLQEEEAAHIIDDIGQADPHGGPGDTDSSDEQTRLRFLVSKDMLDAGSDNGLSCIGPLDMEWHGFEMRLLPVNL
ncbi:hypothetical protein Abci_142_002 [Acetobacter cibinongensis]|uniref:Uncharacterized protein n=1 Tax=Acetobacter cibinongensis TaxID=146475 RepID=A0A0D6N6U9_9PROT|nr:hypothetical protein Abci_142_002 [Acetobacter cibinongensis]